VSKSPCPGAYNGCVCGQGGLGDQAEEVRALCELVQGQAGEGQEEPGRGAANVHQAREGGQEAEGTSQAAQTVGPQMLRLSFLVFLSCCVCLVGQGKPHARRRATH